MICSYERSSSWRRKTAAPNCAPSGGFVISGPLANQFLAYKHSAYLEPIAIAFTGKWRAPRTVTLAVLYTHLQTAIVKTDLRLLAPAPFPTSIPTAGPPQIVLQSKKCGSHQARHLMPDECHSMRHIACDAICRIESSGPTSSHPSLLSPREPLTSQRIKDLRGERAQRGDMARRLL